MGKCQKIGLYARTLRHLRPIQITNRIKRKLIPAKVDTSAAPEVRALHCSDFQFIVRPKSVLGANKFSILNREETLSFPRDWNNGNLPKLWLYNLHYFDGLLNDDTQTELKEALIEEWIEGNPAGQGNGWEPYPNALRIVNWIKWALAGNRLSENAIQSLAVQARYLSETLEYHLLGNHLFVNVKALVFAGCFFEGAEADRWLNVGLKQLIREVSEQFLTDGGHFELSPTYHALLTEDLLDLINVLRVCSKEIPDNWTKTVAKALEWLNVVTHPNGYPPFFNDAAYGISPLMVELSNYSAKLSIKRQFNPLEGTVFLQKSGYFRHYDQCYSVFGDVGEIGSSYQPAHVHCDMLSFELHVQGRPVIVNTGTSTYDVGPLRSFQRSTEAHNTVQIGDLQQSEIWAGFRVGRRAKIDKRRVGEGYIEASHDGYKSMGAIHRRRFEFLDKEFHIIDEMVGFDGLAISRIHFHPDIVPTLDGDKVLTGQGILHFKNAHSIKLKDYDFAPEFNKKYPAKVLEIEFSESLKTFIRF